MTSVMSRAVRRRDHFPVIMRFVPAVIASLLLAAHFLRSGHQVLVLASLGVSFLPLIPRPEARLAHRLLLLAGACEWIRTSVALVDVRIRLGEPWTRMIIILGAVALFTAWSAWLLPRPARRVAPGEMRSQGPVVRGEGHRSPSIP